MYVCIYIYVYVCVYVYVYMYMRTYMCMYVCVCICVCVGVCVCAYVHMYICTVYMDIYGYMYDAQGKFTFSQDDEMLVKVELKTIPRSDVRAAKQLQESISLNQKGIDGTYSGVGL
jgi:hypothetical protein